MIDTQRAISDVGAPRLSIPLNLKKLPPQIPHLLVLYPSQRILNLCHNCVPHPLLPPRININPRRRKQRLREIRHRPPPSPLQLPPPQHLPMTRRDHQPALTAPIPRSSIFAAAGRFDAFYGFDFVGRRGLVCDGGLELRGCLRGGSGEGVVGYCDVAFGFPHWEGGVRYVPCSGEPGGGWEGEGGGLREGSGCGGAEGD